MIDFNNLSSTEYSPVQAESDAINELSFSTQAPVYTQENLGAGTPIQHSATSMTADCTDDRLRMIQSLNPAYQNYNSNPSDVSVQQFMAAQQLQQQLPDNFANLALNHGEVSMNNVNAIPDEWMDLYPATADVPSSLQNSAQANQNISSMPTYYYDKDKYGAVPEYDPFAGPTRLPLNPVDIELPGDRYSQS
ncbi:MAG: hypothetical protein M1824_005992 [Vezdaea acicularis]|nr:MAG: hypothetical protein M1824_005992 [Vezdaea acicularis]